VRVRHRVRADRDAACRVLAEVVPAHRRELIRIVAGELRNRKRRANQGEPGADEDLDRDAEPLERRKDRCRAAKRVVERRAYAREARQRANLSQEEIGPNAEPMLPGRRDGVVTEDERPTAGRHRGAPSAPDFMRP
jgi:hypothetical protein